MFGSRSIICRSFSATTGQLLGPVGAQPLVCLAVLGGPVLGCRVGEFLQGLVRQPVDARVYADRDE